MSSWPILQTPATPLLPITVVTRSETGRSIDTSGVTGRGLLRPFRRDKRQDFASGHGVELVAAAVGQVLGTICSSEQTSGELPWRTEFGSLLHVLRLSNASPALVEKARAFVALALARWEPRARVQAVRVSRVQRAEGFALSIRVHWQLIAQGTDRVLVPGLETEIALG
jgi:phage baseplate assembly protein W